MSTLKCLNCGSKKKEIHFLSYDFISWTCLSCGWKNQEGEYPPGDGPEPVTFKREYLGDKCIVSYPPVYKRDLDILPEKLRDALSVFFTKPDELTKEHRDNIGNNLYRKDPKKYAEKANKNDAKARIIRFLQNTDVSKLFPGKDPKK